MSSGYLTSSMNEPMKHVVDALSIGTVVGALVGILPAIAAVFTIVWTAIRIWETATVRSIIERLRKKE